MKVAAYIRVSTDEQAQEGYSIPAQRNRLEAYATSQEWNIVQWYVDEGESAKDLNRTDLKRLLKDVEQGIFDVVLVYRLDRLTRSVLDLYKLLEKFEKHNVKFKSATEVYDTTTAIGRLFITLVAALAQWERENLGERVRMGMQQKAKEGKWTVSIPPLGYDSNDSILSINHQEAAVVKEIYNLYLSGIGVNKISAQLNERGIKTKKRKPWYPGSVIYILKNPIYYGNTRYNYRVNQEQYFEVEGIAPPIITEEEYNLVQKMLEQRKSAHPRQATSQHIFSKVLKCARCGSTLLGRTSITHRGNKTYYSYSYYCSKKIPGLCDLPYINQNLLEKKFIEILGTWDFEQEVQDVILNETAVTTENLDEAINQIEDQLKKIKKRRDNWQYAWAEGIISLEDFKKRMSEEEEKEKMLQKELKDLTPVETPAQDNLTIELLTNLKLNWQHMTNEQKKQFVLIAIQSLMVDKVSSNRNDPNSIEIKDLKMN